MNNKAKKFEALSTQDIRNQVPGHWEELALLNAVRDFEGKNDIERKVATLELLLHSPEVNSDLAYSEIYFELVELLCGRGDFAGSLRWLHAAIMFDEQHQDGENRDSLRRDLAETYLRAGDFDTGLRIATRSLLNNPQDVWVHNILALCLPNLGLAALTIDILERGLHIVRQDDSTSLKDQFEKLLRESTEKASRESSRLAEISPDVLQAFRSALQSEEPFQSDEASYATLTRELTTADEDRYQAAAAEILSQGKLRAPDLIRIACDESLAAEPTIARAIMLLRQLNASNLVELGELASWLEQANGNWQSTLYSPKFGKVGGLTNEGLEAIMLDTQYNLYLRNDASDAYIVRMQEDATLSERGIALLRHLLTRPEAYESAAEETFLGFLVWTIGEHKIKQLYPEIEAAFLEDRVDPQITDLASVQRDLGMAITHEAEIVREGSFNLLLKCKSCERERRHFVEYVTIDTGTLKRQEAGQSVKYDAYIMDREIVCPKCGARDQYETTSMAMFQLLTPADGSSPLELLMPGRKKELQPNPRVRRFEAHIMGRPMHPLEGVDRYQEMIAANPQDADSYVRMGNILRVLHRHPQALAAFQKGYELEPEDPDGIMACAMAEHDFGDRANARKLYQEAMELALKSPYPEPYLMEVAAAARDGLQALQKNQASPWSVENIRTPTAKGSPQPRSSQPKRQKRPKNKANAAKTKKKKKRNRRK